jgi:translation initiation factor IF-1
MPKNIHGGNKTKKRKNNCQKNYSLIFKESDDYGYAQVVGNLGNGCLSLILLSDKCDDKLLGHIRGKIRRCKFNKDDVVLIGFREFEKDYKTIRNVDVLHKYTDEHVKDLITYKEIKLINTLNGIKVSNDDDDYIVFIKDENDINKFNNEISDSDSNISLEKNNNKKILDSDSNILESESNIFKEKNNNIKSNSDSDSDSNSDSDSYIDIDAI